MQRNSTSIRLVLPLVLSSYAAALSTGTVDMTWPDSSKFAPSAFPTRNVPGHYTAAYAEDVVVLRGTQPVLMVEPGHQTHFKSWPAVANDIDCLPGLPGRVDRLITVGPSGLNESWIDRATASVISTPIDTTDDWLDARFVRVNDIDGDGDSDIVGIHRDGSLVLSKLRDDDTWIEGPAFTIRGVAEGMELLDWSESQNGNSNSLEVAVATSNGFALYDIGGPGQQPMTEIPTLDTVANSLAPMALPDGRYGLATVTPNGSGELVLTILRDVGGSAVADQPPIHLGSGGAVGLRSADLDGDGLSDIGFGDALNARTLIYFSSTAGANNADPAVLDEHVSWSRSLPDPWHMAQPGYADFDEDGHVDSLYPSSSAVRFHAGPIESSYAGGSGSSASSAMHFNTPSVQCADGTLDVSLCYPWLPADHTGWKLQVTIWTRSDITSQLDSARSEHLLDLPGTGETQFDLSLPMPWTAPVASDATLCYVTVRGVLPDGQGGVTDWGRKLTSALWTSGWTASDFDSVCVSPPVLGILDSCEDGSAPTSGFVEIARLPVIPSSAPPPMGGGSAIDCSIAASHACNG